MAFGLLAGLILAGVSAGESLYKYVSGRRNLKQRISQIKSAQIQGYSKSGVLLEGTPQEVIDSTKRIGDERLKDYAVESIGEGVIGATTSFLSGYESSSLLGSVFSNQGIQNRVPGLSSRRKKVI